MTMVPYPEFEKIPRLDRDTVVTEKIDGVNARVAILTPEQWRAYDNPPYVARYLGEGEDPARDMFMCVGSRATWINHHQDNEGFARWARTNAEELWGLGPGEHSGEWYGSGIRRGYGLPRGECRFMLFNVERWADDAHRPACCEVSTVLDRGSFLDVITALPDRMSDLQVNGSQHVSGFPRPEGVVVYHVAAGQAFKMTWGNDGHKGAVAPFGDMTAVGARPVSVIGLPGTLTMASEPERLAA